MTVPHENHKLETNGDARCVDCRRAMSRIGTFRGVPQWLCVECGWVSIGEGDARWA